MENEKTKKEIKFTTDELLLIRNLVYTELKYTEFIEENKNRINSMYEKKVYTNLFKKLDKILFKNLEV